MSSPTRLSRRARGPSPARKRSTSPRSSRRRVASPKANGSEPTRGSASGTPTKSERSDDRTRRDSVRASLFADPAVLKGSDFQGFVNFVFIATALYCLDVMATDWYATGFPVDSKLWGYMCMENNWEWFLCFLAMSTFSCSAFVVSWGVKKRLLNLGMASILFQVAQCVMFTLPTKYALERQLPMATSAFIVMEQIVLSMKMHSYFTTCQTLARRHRWSESVSGTPPQPSSSGPHEYPNNVTFKNYLYFLVVPTLVYETSYERCERINWKFFLQKLFEMIGTMTCLYFILKNILGPIYESSKEPGLFPFFQIVLRLAIPSVVAWFCLFYIVFECIMNMIAELTRFADREFYHDWWNATEIAEFNRKWNRPVHMWLYRHVYLETLKSGRLGGRWGATIVTFLFSAVLHELLFSVIFRMARFWMFTIMMLQIPHLILMRKLLPYLQKVPRLDNMLFWVSFFFGFPLIQICYTWEFHLNNAS